MTNVGKTAVTLSNGVNMPQFGLGVWQSPAGEATENAVKWALQAGYRHIDTAAIYKNEESVGAGLRASGVPREEVFITTKLWNTEHGYESTLAAFEESRKRLGVQYIDLYLIHWPRGNAILLKEGKKYLDSWRAFERLYADKKVRAIGVSNFNIHHLEDVLAMCSVPPMVNQVELHPLNNQAELRAFCDAKGIKVEAWSPLGQGNLVTHPLLITIGEKYKKTAAQVMLRWDIQHNLITIPKSVHKERVEENANIFDFELSAEDMANIDALNSNVRYGPNPDEAQF
ncbi:prostaglandin f2-alpha synthase/D-arabinose dehydrogenase [Leishmania panamensis]|uniref:9,11-endoperoxide prostaglandin H2 reductase n=1 Tax=Leishmania panamensis TaxID=5679 RepID=A0A088RXB1_LEIPA|nr:prostaglandin f2-alpha synthase/D-arabinose dehydrogenase [Leishmania panamensis]AIO00788.1 prostaglandin f2-alpha synthase/D-arabinose dehydrogenase [Leishmania panamensis]